jgi:uncharacterized protein (TIGR00299 family) protein
MAEQITERGAFFDCFSGISGDMTLGAFIDLGLELGELKDLFAAMGLKEVTLSARTVSRQHLAGVKVEVKENSPPHARTYGQILDLLAQAPVSPTVRQRSLDMLRRLGEVEARLHRQPLEEVHLHELGGLDTIVDLVGAAYGAEKFGITRVYCSPLPMGWGMIAAGHGRLPNPAPATMEILQGLPVYGTDIRGELVTPTGAAILKGLGAIPEPCPPMTLEQVGYGAGGRDLPGHPNLLRVYLGRPLPAAAGIRERVLVMETHIDDMNPELYEPLMAALFEAGALDVALGAIHMKKQRPGVRLTIIAPPAAREGLLDKLFSESTTLGVRFQEVERVAARRWQESIATPYGELEVKVMEYGGRRRLMPEYEACRRLAQEHGLPLLEVYRFIDREDRGV